MRKIFTTARQQYYLSQEGLLTLKSKLQSQNKEKLERIESLRLLKDQQSDSLSSEDSTYMQALDSLRILEADIEKNEHILAHAKILKTKTKRKDSEVTLGSRVTLKNGTKEIEYMIVDSLEADPSQGKISDKSPLGKQLLGKRLRDYITLQHLRSNKPLSLRLISIK